MAFNNIKTKKMAIGSTAEERLIRASVMLMEHEEFIALRSFSGWLQNGC